MNENETALRPVLVTTIHRGVFFGYTSQPDDSTTITLENVRNAIYWSGSRGFLGLASHGPESGSRIGARAPRLTLQGVTSVADVTPEAVAVWESA